MLLAARTTGSRVTVRGRWPGWYAYRLPSATFVAFEPPVAHAHVSREPVRPLGPAERVGDLLALHEQEGIQLRVLRDLWPFWDAVVTSTLGFSGIRLRHARARDVRSRPG